MSHAQQRAFVESVREQFPEHFHNARVLEIGSYFVNGSVRSLFVNCEYVGADVAPGLCVDLVCPNGYAEWARENQAPESFDTVISAECLEHDESWQETLEQAVLALRHGGLLILTVAGKGRQEHGTRRTSPQDSLLQTDYYRGLDGLDIGLALSPMQHRFSAWEFSKCLDPSDTYLWAVKI